MICRAPFSLILIAGLTAGGIASAQAEELSTLEGSWIMEQAYEIRADGTRTTNYGEHPKGLLTIDHAGRYNLQIFTARRTRFVCVLQTSEAAVYSSAVPRVSSTHF